MIRASLLRCLGAGVALVAVNAPAKYAVRVDVDPNSLAAYGIGIDEAAMRDRYPLAYAYLERFRPRGQFSHYRG